MQPAPKQTESDEVSMSETSATQELNQPTLPFTPGWEEGLSLPPLMYRTIGERRAASTPKPNKTKRESAKRSHKKSVFSLAYWFDGDTRREIRLWMDERDFRFWAAGLVLLFTVLGLIVVLSELGTPKVVR
jgi:hypothetical protein